MSITKEDLYLNQYDYQTLKTNIYVVSLLDILKSQTLTEEFCVKYILNSDFQLLDEENMINVELVKKYQPHLRDSKLITNKRLKYKRVNSFEDFESYLNRHL
jgi:hypothetical protein